MSNTDRDELDKLLDAGLATYTSEPRPGIENRILAGLANAEVPNRRRWRWWLAVAIPAAACLVVMFANREAPPLGLWPQDPLPYGRGSVTEQNRDRKGAEGPNRAVKALVVEPGPRPRAQRIVRAAKRAQFPTPAPLTPEERALRDLATRAPEALRLEFAAEIRIEPIQIEPLQTGGASEELNQ